MISDLVASNWRCFCARASGLPARRQSAFFWWLSGGYFQLRDSLMMMVSQQTYWNEKRKIALPTRVELVFS
jgi:hypothetical protein